MTTKPTTYDLLKEIFLLLDDGDRQLLGQFDLTIPRFYVLFHLGRIPGLSPNNLSELMFCDKSNITRLIKGMEDEGLVRRQPHEKDGRSVRLFLTPVGEEIRAQALQAHNVYNDSRFAHELFSQEGPLIELLKLLRQQLQLQLRGAAVT